MHNQANNVILYRLISSGLLLVILMALPLIILISVITLLVDTIAGHHPQSTASEPWPQR